MAYAGGKRKQEAAISWAFPAYGRKGAESRTSGIMKSAALKTRRFPPTADSYPRFAALSCADQLSQGSAAMASQSATNGSGRIWASKSRNDL
jgi:hypothetical protein